MLQQVGNAQSFRLVFYRSMKELCVLHPNLSQQKVQVLQRIQQKLYHDVKMSTVCSDYVKRQEKSLVFSLVCIALEGVLY